MVFIASASQRAQSLVLEESVRPACCNLSRRKAVGQYLTTPSCIAVENPAPSSRNEGGRHIEQRRWSEPSGDKSIVRCVDKRRRQQLKGSGSRSDLTASNVYRSTHFLLIGSYKPRIFHYQISYTTARHSVRKACKHNAVASTRCVLCQKVYAVRHRSWRQSCRTESISRRMTQTDRADRQGVIAKGLIHKTKLPPEYT